jgi:predicted lipoprotein
MSPWGTGTAWFRVAVKTGLASLCFALSACAPWTVRRIEDEDQAKTANKLVFDPVAYVDSIWDAKVVPAVLSSAVDAHILLQSLAVSPDEARRKYGRREGNGVHFVMVKGEGRVLSIDSSSRSRLVLLDIAPFDQRPDVSIQLGPVLRGTSLRDTTGIVRFTDFANQLQFADVGNELNAHALKSILDAIDQTSLNGRIVSFAGTSSLEDAGQPPIHDVVPVRLVVEAQR